MELAGVSFFQSYRPGIEPLSSVRPAIHFLRRIKERVKRSVSKKILHMMPCILTARCDTYHFIPVGVKDKAPLVSGHRVEIGKRAAAQFRRRWMS